MTASAPTPERIADCLMVAQMGGDLARLSLVCTHQAALHEGVGRQRLLDSAAALGWAARLLAALEAQEAQEEKDGG
jgi:hypothetical protein